VRSGHGVQKEDRPRQTFLAESTVLATRSGRSPEGCFSRSISLLVNDISVLRASKKPRWRGSRWAHDLH